MPGLTHDINSSPTLVDSSPATETSKRTNTLVLAQLPTPFFHPRVMDALRDHFASHGTIRAWAPLRTFSRVVVVYESEDSADEAKAYCDGLEIDATPETYVVHRSDRCAIRQCPCHASPPIADFFSPFFPTLSMFTGPNSSSAYFGRTRRRQLRRPKPSSVHQRSKKIS
jgi:hypothetical protein